MVASSFAEPQERQQLNNSLTAAWNSLLPRYNVVFFAMLRYAFQLVAWSKFSS